MAWATSWRVELCRKCPSLDRSSPQRNMLQAEFQWLSWHIAEVAYSELPMIKQPVGTSSPVHSWLHVAEYSSPRGYHTVEKTGVLFPCSQASKDSQIRKIELTWFILYPTQIYLDHKQMGKAVLFSNSLLFHWLQIVFHFMLSKSANMAEKYHENLETLFCSFPSTYIASKFVLT